MPFTSRRQRGSGYAFAMLIALLLPAAGCATAVDPMRAEPGSFAKQLGLPDCKVSLPLTPADAVEMGKRWQLYPDPRSDPQWVEMISLRQPGDELRLISCRVGTPYFYALIRNEGVIFQYPLPVLD